MDTKSPDSKDLVLELSVRLHFKLRKLTSKKSWLITLALALIQLGLTVLIKHL